MTAYEKLNRKLFTVILMLLMTALQTFGQVKSDSILVSRIDLIKQIELNDKRKAQIDYCAEAITKADSVVLASRLYITALDTVIALKDETISLLTLVKDEAKRTIKEQDKQLKAERKKGNRKAIGWGVGSGAVGFMVGATLILIRN